MSTDGLAFSPLTPPLVMGVVYIRGEIGEDHPFCSIICYAIASSPSAPGHSPVRFSVVGDMLDVLSG